MTIPTRSTRSHTGELHGAAPVPHQVKQITVTIEQLAGGRWRLTQPRVPGWVQAARTASELAIALRQGFTEAQVAAHSDWRMQTYDGSGPIYHRPARRGRSHRRNDVYDCREWRRVGDTWLSPKGHRYPEHTDAVQRVMAARRKMGLPDRPEPTGDTANMTAQNVVRL